MPSSPLSSSLKRRRGRGHGRLSPSALCIRRASIVFMVVASSFSFVWNIFVHLDYKDLQQATGQDKHEHRRGKLGGELRVLHHGSSASEWESLHDKMYDAACSEFDHSIRRPKHGCEVNKDTKIVFCNFDNLRIDTTKIQMEARGGENLSEVMKRPEEDEFPTYNKAAFSTPIKPKFDVPTDYRSNLHYLENVLNAMRYPTKQNRGKLDLSCEQTYPGTTLFVTRYEYVNLYHTLTDLWNAFFILPRKGKSKGSGTETFDFGFGALPTTSNGIRSSNNNSDDDVLQKPDRVVFLDGHAKGLLDSVWETLFGEYHYIRHIGENAGGGGTCFERAMFIPSGYKSPLQKNYQREACFHKGMAKAFSDFVLQQYGLLPSQKSKVVKGRIVVIDRQPFISHPRSDRKNAARQFHNSEIRELQNQLGRIPGVTVRLVRLEKLSFREQLELVRDTHVLIGIHGAGLSHLLFMDETQSHSIEFESNFLEHFAYLSEWKGMDHKITDLTNNGIEDAVRMVKNYMHGEY